jgi:hypothetical protein
VGIGKICKKDLNNNKNKTMKKLFLTAMLIGMVGVAKAQWTFKKVDNGFDEPYKVAYTNTNNFGFLKMEKYNDGVTLYVKGSFFCGEKATADISFWANNEWQKYTIDCNVSTDNSIVWLIEDLGYDKVFLTHFMNSTKVRIRITTEGCDNDIFEFPMGNSARAYQFMKTQP